MKELILKYLAKWLRNQGIVMVDIDDLEYTERIATMYMKSNNPMSYFGTACIKRIGC